MIRLFEPSTARLWIRRLRPHTWGDWLPQQWVPGYIRRHAHRFIAENVPDMMAGKVAPSQVSLEPWTSHERPADPTNLVSPCRAWIAIR